MQKRQADEIGGISCAKLSHRLGAMAFKGPWADAHPHRALLVGAALADELENLALALGQRLLIGIG